MPLPDTVKLDPRVAGLASEMRAWRRHLHAHPETAFEEHETAAFVAERLRDFGLSPVVGVAGTGVVASLTGRRPGTRAIALRADMDALHVREENDFEHRSRNAGRMHACGHDGHTAMLLGAARALSEEPDFAGTVHFVFQPAEENEGGGRAMLEDGLFERFPTDAVFGMHNWPGLPVGRMAMKPGAMMGGFDTFEIVIIGNGCHSAMPYMGNDPMVAAGQLLCSLQTIPGRNLHPLDGAVVSTTQIFGGDTWNVIPDRVTIRGTARYFKVEVQNVIEGRLADLAGRISAAFNCTASVRYEHRYPPTVNSVHETAVSAAAAAQVVGEAAIDHDPLPSMGAEDFAFMLQRRPGCYVWLGNGPIDGGCLLHSAQYDFNDDVAPIGASYWVKLVEQVLRAP